MCVHLLVRGHHCMTMADLAEVIGLDTIVIAPDYPANVKQLGACLCPVDLEATAAKLGAWVDYETDPLEYRFVEATNDA